jgi:DNA-binding MarR family transcriptional regulator
MAKRLDDTSMHGLLGYSVARADISLRRAFMEVGRELDVRPAEYSALVVLAHNDDVSPGALGKALSISAPNLAVMLERLNTRGLISRTPRKEDRRGHVIKLTVAGKQLVKRGKALEPLAEGRVTSRLTPAERALLVELLQKIVE